MISDLIFEPDPRKVPLSGPDDGKEIPPIFADERRQEQFRLEQRDRQEKVKLACLRAELILDVLNFCNCPPSYLALPVTNELPSGAIVTDIWFDHSRRMFVCRIHHPSFDRVAPGWHPPFLEDRVMQLYRRDENTNQLVKVE